FRSSVFTHHFLAGLRGMGDVNHDRLVTLGEAYSYSSEQTLKTSLNTLAGSQHATFEYDLRGRADPVLTDLRTRNELAELVLEGGGRGGGLFAADPARPLPGPRPHRRPGVRDRAGTGIGPVAPAAAQP